MEAIMLFFILLGALTNDIGAELTRSYYCDIIEINEVYSDTNGKKRFTQLIFWQWRQSLNYKTGRQEWGYFVREWRMVDEEKPPIVRYDHRRKVHVLLLHNKHDCKIQTVIAPSFRRSKTYYDVEVEDRKRLPIDVRKKLLAR
jgi:hypothetical protein